MRLCQWFSNTVGFRKLWFSEGRQNLVESIRILLKTCVLSKNSLKATDIQEMRKLKSLLYENYSKTSQNIKEKSSILHLFHEWNTKLGLESHSVWKSPTMTHLNLSFHYFVFKIFWKMEVSFEELLLIRKKLTRQQKASKKTSDTYLKALMEVKRCKKRVNFILQQQQQQNALGTESFASLIATLEARAPAKKKCSGPNSGAQTKWDLEQWYQRGRQILMPTWYKVSDELG